MSLFSELTKKPWVPAQAVVDNAEQGSLLPLPAATLGLRVLLGVMTVLFSLFVIAYSDRMVVAGWRPLPEPWLLWLNTVILVLSSAAMHRAVLGAREGDADRVKTGLQWAGISAFAFLAGQLWAWQLMVAEGYYAATNPANAYFYLLTAVHGLHLLGGLVAWYRASARVRRASDVAEGALGVELCAIYWHFLLVVWLVLFGLLLFT